MSKYVMKQTAVRVIISVESLIVQTEEFAQAGIKCCLV